MMGEVKCNGSRQSRGQLALSWGRRASAPAVLSSDIPNLAGVVVAESQAQDAERLFQYSLDIWKERPKHNCESRSRVDERRNMVVRCRKSAVRDWSMQHQMRPVAFRG